MSWRSLPFLVLFLSACGRGPSVVPTDVEPDNAPETSEALPKPPPPVTTLTPPPGSFHGEITITLLTNVPATVLVTLDGSDPREASPVRLSGPAPFSFVLKKTSMVSYCARTEEGAAEIPRTRLYIREGGTPGTISGVVHVGNVAVGRKLALLNNGSVLSLPEPTKEGDVPFVIQGLMTGTYRLQAVSDRDGTGDYSPWSDVSSEVQAISLNLADPRHASAEGIQLYLGTSAPHLVTLAGTVTIPKPVEGMALSVLALAPEMFAEQADPNALLRELQEADRVVTKGEQTIYPYSLTDLPPATYLAVPLLSGIGTGGVAMNLIVSPFAMVTPAAGETGITDFRFGPTALSGIVTLRPMSLSTGFVYGLVVARAFTFFDGIQAVIMPTVFRPSDLVGGAWVGSYAGQALRDNALFELQVFTNLDGKNPLPKALAWVINPFSSQAPLAELQTRGASVTQDLEVP